MSDLKLQATISYPVSSGSEEEEQYQDIQQVSQSSEKPNTGCSKSSKKQIQVQGNDMKYVIQSSPNNEANHTAENIKVAQDADLFPEVPKQTQNPIEASVLGLPQVEPVLDDSMPHQLTLKVKQVIKYLSGKCWGPKGLSLLKDLTGYKNLHSLISGYGPDKRPKQLLTPKMILDYVSVEYLNCGGWNTMRDVINQKVLIPTEEALEKLKLTYDLSDPAQLVSLRESIELIHRMHYNDAPALFFIMSQFYSGLYKLINKSSSECKPKEIKKDLYAQSQGKSSQGEYPHEINLSPRELARLNTILNEIAAVLKRLTLILGGVDWVEQTPKGMVDKLHTYWNQDLMFAPGNLIFILDSTPIPAEKQELKPYQNHLPFGQLSLEVETSSNFDSASVYQSEQTTDFRTIEGPETQHLMFEKSSEPLIVEEPASLDGDCYEFLKMSLFRDNLSQDTQGLRESPAYPDFMWEDYNLN
jgi:ribosomal protein L29